MNENLTQIFQNCQIYEPASDEKISEIENNLGLALSPEYLRLLKFSDGLDGWLNDKIYIELWPVEKLIELNDYYQTRESIPGIILIGSDGSDEAIALDLRENSQNYGSFFLMPFIPFDWEEAEKMGETIEQFIKKFKNPFNLPEK